MNYSHSYIVSLRVERTYRLYYILVGIRDLDHSMGSNDAGSVLLAIYCIRYMYGGTTTPRRA